MFKHSLLQKLTLKINLYYNIQYCYLNYKSHIPIKENKIKQHKTMKNLHLILCVI